MRAVRSLLEGAVLAEKPHKHTQHARTHRDKVNRSRRVISSRSGRCWPRNHTHIHNTQHTTHNTQRTHTAVKSTALTVFPSPGAGGGGREAVA